MSTTYTGEELPQITFDSERYLNAIALDLLGIRQNLMKESLESLGLTFDKFSEDILNKAHKEAGDICVSSKTMYKNVYKHQKKMRGRLPKSVKIKDVWLNSNKHMKNNLPDYYLENDVIVPFHVEQNDFAENNIDVRNVRFNNWLVNSEIEGEPSHVGIDYGIIYRFGMQPSAFILPPDILEYVKQERIAGAISDDRIPRDTKLLKRGAELYKLYIDMFGDRISEYSLIALFGNFYVEGGWNVHLYNKTEAEAREGSVEGTHGMTGCGEGLYGLTFWPAKLKYINAIGNELNPVITPENYIGGGKPAPTQIKNEQPRGGTEQSKNEQSKNEQSILERKKEKIITNTTKSVDNFTNAAGNFFNKLNPFSRGGNNEEPKIETKEVKDEPIVKPSRDVIKPPTTVSTKQQSSRSGIHGNNWEEQTPYDPTQHGNSKKKHPKNPNSKSFYFDTTKYEGKDPKNLPPQPPLPTTSGIGKGPYLYHCDEESWGKILMYYLETLLRGDEHGDNLLHSNDKSAICFSSYLFKAAPAKHANWDDVKETIEAYRKTHAKQGADPKKKNDFALAMYIAYMLAEYMNNVYIYGDKDGDFLPDMSELGG